MVNTDLGHGNWPKISKTVQIFEIISDGNDIHPPCPIGKPILSLYRFNCPAHRPQTDTHTLRYREGRDHKCSSTNNYTG